MAAKSTKPVCNSRYGRDGCYCRGCPGLSIAEATDQGNGQRQQTSLDYDFL
jgi:hypothetical protein